MGFRNPVLTAIDQTARDAAAAAAAAAADVKSIDTAGAGALSDPGVRIFQDLTTSPRRGVAEWRTGNSLHTPATAVIDGILQTTAGGPQSVPRWKFTGPARSDVPGVAGASLLSYVEQLPDLTWRSRVDLAAGLFGVNGVFVAADGTVSAGKILSAAGDLTSAGTDPSTLTPKSYVDASAPRIQRVWHFNRGGNASDAITVGSFVTLIAATIANAPAGDYLITFRCVVSNTTAQAGFQAVTINGSASADGNPRADCTVANGRMTFTQAVGWTHTGGDATLRGAYQAAAGVPTVWSQGTQLSIAYLGPRS